MIDILLGILAVGCFVVLIAIPAIPILLFIGFLFSKDEKPQEIQRPRIKQGQTFLHRNIPAPDSASPAVCRITYVGDDIAFFGVGAEAQHGEYSARIDSFEYEHVREWR